MNQTINDYNLHNNEPKRCSKCCLYQPRYMFYVNNKNIDGLQNYCKDCARKYMRPYMNKKYKDPEFYKIQLMRNSLRRGHTLYGLKKYLDCTPKFFNIWLEMQRVVGHTIVDEQLDHVLPVAQFANKPYTCWNWINIRPVSKTTNQNKRDKIDLKLYTDQLVLARSFTRLINRISVFFYTLGVENYM